MKKETQVSLRRASLEDTPVLVDLTGQLGYKMTVAALSRNVEAYLQDPDRALFVAEIEGAILGYIALDAAVTFHREGKQARVVSLVIDRLHRGSGLGALLLQAGEEWARQQSSWVIELTSSSAREKEGTHDFYLKQGYFKNGSQAYFRKLM